MNSFSTSKEYQAGWLPLFRSTSGKVADKAACSVGCTWRWSREWVCFEELENLVGGLEHESVFFHISWEFHHPNWWMSYFSEGVKPQTRSWCWCKWSISEWNNEMLMQMVHFWMNLNIIEWIKNPHCQLIRKMLILWGIPHWPLSQTVTMLFAILEHRPRGQMLGVLVQNLRNPTRWCVCGRINHFDYRIRILSVYLP